MRKIYTAIILILIAFTGTGQQKFQKAIDRDFGTNNIIADYGHDIKQTADGGYIVVGHTESFGIGNHDVFLVKLNQYGDTVWSKIYGTIQEEEGQKVTPTSDGGYAVAGYTKGAGAGIEDIFMMKTDSLGTLLWSHTYGSANEERLYDIKETSDSGFVLVGESEFQDGSWLYKDVLIIKTDPQGDTLWTKIYGDLSGDQNVIGRSIVQTTDGGYAVAGSDATYSGGAAFLMKLNASGDTSWVRSYGDLGAWPDGYSVQQTTDGGYIIGARTFTGGFGSSADAVIIKVDNTGNILWSKVYGGTNVADYLINAFETSDGGYFIGGGFDNNGVSSLTSVKTNSTGTISWAKAYASQFGSSYAFEGYYGMTHCSDGGFALIAELSNQFGNTLSELYNGTDMLVVKTDSNGDSYGCQQTSIGIQEQPFSISAHPTTFEDSSGTSVSSNVFIEQETDINIMHAGTRFFMNETAVTCGGSCDGFIQANPCDSNGFYCSGANPYSYQWNDPNSQTTMTATGLCTGTYTVTVTDNDGCWGIDSVTLATTAPNQSLCIVTVDSTSTHNLLSWEKPTTTGIDSFRVYRLIAGTGYTWIGSVHYDSLSQFVDTTNGINPNTTSYRYKVSTLDTCGNEGTLSEYHETIHLTTSLGIGNEINLIWDPYVGNISTFFYRILRDTSGVGLWEVIDSVPETNFTYTDANPIAGVNNGYMIEVVPPFTCTSTKAVNYSSSRSNRPSNLMPVAPLNANFSAASVNISEGQSITFNDQSSGSPISWLWYFEGATPDSSLNQNPSGITYSTAGTYDVTLIVSNGIEFDTLIQTDYITVVPNNGAAPIAEFIASATTINIGDSINFTDLTANAPTSWSWVFSNGNPSSSNIQNPTNIKYNTAGTFDVSLVTSNSNGSDSEIKIGYITVLGVSSLNESISEDDIKIYPNPTNGNFYINTSNPKPMNLSIYNSLGKLVGYHSSDKALYELDLPRGIYQLVFLINDKNIIKRVVVE